jgi:Ca2+-transporting ATPase
MREIRDMVSLEKAASVPLQALFDELETSPNGLTTEEAKARIKKYGSNRLVEKKKVPLIANFIFHLKDLFGVLLLVASVLAFISGNPQLSLVILGVVFLNIFFSLFQESRAEKALQTLKKWMPEYAKVMRDGELTKILVKQIVPGDIIELEEGDRVPADARLIEAFDLWTNNVPLTGESEPQPRSTVMTKAPDKAYLDSQNLVFMSTSVAKGQGKAIVISTGMQTQFGRIANLTQSVKAETSPLHKEIERMAKYDLVLSAIVGVAFFLLSFFWLQVSVATSIFFMIGVMLCFVPEGLQVTVSSALAINVVKMVKNNVLVKRLSSVQTLGSVTVICTDKTGTITKGEMTVEKLWVPENQTVDVSGLGYMPVGEFSIKGKELNPDEIGQIEKLLEISALCNGAKVLAPSDQNKTWTVVGDPTDGALIVAALKSSVIIEEILDDLPIVDILPFSFERKRMTTIHQVIGGYYAYTKGAPRVILELCNKILCDGIVEDLTSETQQLIENKIDEFANQGLRVIAVAYRFIPRDAYSKETAENELIFVGLAGMMDPPRLEVREAIEKAREAGITTVIITGDYGPTAEVVARKVGIVTEDCCNVIHGVDLVSDDDKVIVDAVKRGNVIFARVSPEQKLRIVKAIKKSGEVVAVTGDGANDAPSLKEADVGIAMGFSGTDVAREAADIVLLDDSFKYIVKAIESGRAIYENIRKFIAYVFTHNIAQLIPFLLYGILGIPLPLLVLQILAIDLAIEIIPSLALSREPPELGIMQEPPRSIKERLFTSKVLLRSLYIGIVIAVGAMIGGFAVWSHGGWTFSIPVPAVPANWHFDLPFSQIDPIYLKGTTMVFAGIVLGQVGNVLACRTNKQSIFRTSLSTNKWILVGIAAQLSILAVIIYVPFLQPIFGTQPLGLRDWAYLAPLPIVVIVAEEVRKFVTRHLSKRVFNRLHDH